MVGFSRIFESRDGSGDGFKITLAVVDLFSWTASRICFRSAFEIPVEEELDDQNKY
jgi:hypothetical protein